MFFFGLNQIQVVENVELLCIPFPSHSSRTSGIGSPKDLLHVVT